MCEANGDINADVVANYTFAHTIADDISVRFVMAETTKHLPTTQDDPATDHHPIEDAKPYKWYRGVFFQATVVGFCAFTAPGLWNAIINVTATFLTSSILINRLNFRYALALGTVGYSIYSAVLYQNNCHRTQWFIYLGSATCGITAGFFWAAEGAIMLSYPPPEHRGKYLAYWLAYRNSGSILGGAITLAFNYSGWSLGKLNRRTYIVFIVLQCLGPAVALLLSNPDKVQRRDGSKIPTLPRIPASIEFKETMKLMLRKDFLLLYVPSSLKLPPSIQLN
ncbi:hypothetical protein Q7P35_006296 [Cladosporium inversicolor]